MNIYMCGNTRVLHCITEKPTGKINDCNYIWNAVVGL